MIDAVAIGLGAIVGAGIFVVIGVAAGVAGPSLLAGIAIAGTVAAANALSSAQLAATYPQSGGTYEYANRLLNPWIAFVAGWMFLTSKIAAAGTVALGFGAYLHVFAPGLSPRVVAFAAIIAFTAANYLGIRRTSALNLVIVGTSLLVLVLFAALTLPAFRWENLKPFTPFGIDGLLESAALLFFAYTGYARIATLGEEVRNPEVTIPRAILITIGMAISLYLLVATAAVGAVDSTSLGTTPAPLALAAEASGRRWLPIVVSIGGVVAMLGVLLSQVLGTSRMVFAMARGGDLPSLLNAISPTYHVPGRATLLVGMVCLLVTATGSLTAIASTASFAILVYYGIANLCALKLKRASKLYPDWVPAFGLVSCALLAFSLSSDTVLTGIAVLIIGLLFRMVIARMKTS